MPETMSKKIDCNFYFGDNTINRKKLFEEALSFSKHGKVLYIMHEEPNELPQLSQELQTLNKHYMKMITFLYVKSLDSLLESISTLPEWQNIPSTIIIDDLYAYYGENELQNACGVVAFLLDTVQSCSMSLQAPCRLCVSVCSNASQQYCNTLKELYCTH